MAKASYTKYGFKGYELEPKAGHAIFWEKKIPNTEIQKSIELLNN